MRKAIYEELDRIKKTGIRDQELEKAKNIRLVEFYQQMRTINGRANTIGTYEVFFGDYRKLFDAAKNYGAVTKEDVQRVAREYFGPNNRTVATLIRGRPAGRGERQVMSRRQPVMRILCSRSAAFPVLASWPKAQPEISSHEKMILKNGMTVLLMEKRGVPMVRFAAIVKAGSTADPVGQEGLASVTAGLLRKGTNKRSAQKFAKDLDFIGDQFRVPARARILPHFR